MKKYNKEIVEYFLETDLEKFQQKVEWQSEHCYKLLINISLGISFEQSCHLANISTTQFYDWKNSKTKDYHAEFAECIEKADAYFEMYHVNKINESKGWQASAWMLERRYPERWKPKSEILQKNMTLQEVMDELRDKLPNPYDE